MATKFGLGADRDLVAYQLVILMFICLQITYRLETIIRRTCGDKRSTKIAIFIIIVIICIFVRIVIHTRPEYLPPISHPLNCSVDHHGLWLRRSCYGPVPRLLNDTTNGSFQVRLLRCANNKKRLHPALVHVHAHARHVVDVEMYSVTF